METPVDLLRSALPAAAIEVVPSIDMPTIAVARDQILEVGRTLREDSLLQFALLVDLTAVDLFPAEPRYEIVYHLASLGPHFAQPGGAAAPSRLRVKVRLPGTDPRIPTVTSIWPVAGWLEREVFDLFGIVFEGHPDLRRLLMPDDWEGYPLRKDYPVQIRKDTESWSPMQVSPEEFARNIRARREQAQRDGAPGTKSPDQ